MLSSSLVRQGIAELACKQGKSSDEVKEFSEGYACISCFRAVSRYVMLKEVESQLLNKLSASRPVEMDGSIQAKCCMAGTQRPHASAGSVERTMKVNLHHLCSHTLYILWVCVYMYMYRLL